MTSKKSFKSVLALGGCVLAMAAVAPTAFAGEDEDDDSSAPARVHSTAGGGGGGGSDSGSASGGVQAGFGGMSATGDPSLLIPLGLLGGGLVALSAAGTVARRRVPQL